MTARIVLLTGSHLCHNPRVIKEATTLADAGYDVEVLGGWFDPQLKERDRRLMQSARFRYTPVIDGTASRHHWLALRTRSKLGSLLHRAAHVENRWQLGYAYGPMRRAAFARTADLFIAHSEQAMAVAVALRRAGRRVGVDMEDWFSEDLLPEVRAHRPIRLLRALERDLLCHGCYASCTSLAMSAALQQDYGCPPPAVLYNAFPWSERKSIDGMMKDRRNRDIPSIHWFSQTLGPGRGLEQLVAALPMVSHPAEIHLRGRPAAGFEAWLRERMPENWRERLFVHDIVPNEELLSRIAEHDIGFAGEGDECRSRDLTVSNKILQYLLAGLAVVASGTTGQREILKEAGEATLTYPVGDTSALAACLNALLESAETLAQARAVALNVAQQTFCWDTQKKVLLNLISRSLRSPS